MGQRATPELQRPVTSPIIVTVVVAVLVRTAGPIRNLAHYRRIRDADDQQRHKVHGDQAEQVVGRLERLILGERIERHALMEARKVGMHLDLEEDALRQRVHDGYDPGQH